MKSFNESNMAIEYKSSLELKSFRYCDANPKIKRFSVEPFAIPYIKPTDNKKHRYYIDIFIEFESGAKFLVEVKSSGETRPPRKPNKLTHKSERNYRRALQTWHINSAKWEAAKKFCETHDMGFVFLTEKELS